MNKIETHPFGYYLPENADKLIIGSFPCRNANGYGDWFYSGSGKNDFWELLSEVYGMPADTKVHKMEICDRHKIAITDIGGQVERIKGNCSDSNLNIIVFNTTDIEKCLIPSIRKVLFTSKFVEKHFIKVFRDMQIPCLALPSPSPSANRYFSRSEEYKELVKLGAINPAYQYRLKKYREYLLNDT